MCSWTLRTGGMFAAIGYGDRRTIIGRVRGAAPVLEFPEGSANRCQKEALFSIFDNSEAKKRCDSATLGPCVGGWRRYGCSLRVRSDGFFLFENFSLDLSSTCCETPNAVESRRLCHLKTRYVRLYCTIHRYRTFYGAIHHKTPCPIRCSTVRSADDVGIKGQSVFSVVN